MNTIIFLSSKADLLDFIKFIVPPITTVLAGYLGLQYGLKQIKTQKRLEFIEKQLKEFYSPLLGIHKYIDAKSCVRLKFKNISDENLKKNPITEIDPSFEVDDNEIQYNNKQFEGDLLPMYREMLKIFRDNYWLAESETKAFYKILVEYVEGWDRWNAKTIRPQAMRESGHSEKNLEPFYKELEIRMEVLRSELSK